MLNKKILRDIWKNKSQFITIFLMVFLAVFAFSWLPALPVQDPRVSYKSALAKSVCQQLSNNKGICHLPLRELNPGLLQLLTFNTH